MPAQGRAALPSPRRSRWSRGCCSTGARSLAPLTDGAYRPFVLEPDRPVAKWDETVVAVRAALDEQTVSDATAMGSRMSIEELISFVTIALDRARASL